LNCKKELIPALKKGEEEESGSGLTCGGVLWGRYALVRRGEIKEGGARFCIQLQWRLLLRGAGLREVLLLKIGTADSKRIGN